MDKLNDEDIAFIFEMVKEFRRVGYSFDEAHAMAYRIIKSRS